MRVMIKNKKGLSAVVTNLIIILLVIVAVGIVWVVVSNLLGETSGGINLGQITLSMEIKKVTIDGNNVGVQVERKSGEGNLTGIKFLVYDSKGNSQAFEEDASTLKELDTRTFTLEGYTGADVAKVEVAPIFTTDKGKQKVLDVADTYDLSEYAGITQCEVEGDCGTDGTVAECVGGYVYDVTHDYSCVDGSCQDDSSSVLVEECTGATPVCSGGECVESEPECGDGAVEGSEECDGTNLNGGTCASVVGSGYIGTLSCSASSCTFITTGCEVSSGPITLKGASITEDNQLIGDNIPGRDVLNYGLSTGLRSGKDCWGAYHEQVSLIKFDLSSISCSTISNAELRLYQNAFNAGGCSTTGATIGPYILKADWVEGSSLGVEEAGASCWADSKRGISSWETAGAKGTTNDIEASPVDQADLGSSTVESWVVYDVTSAVQSWLSGSKSNYGFALHKISGNGYASFRSSDYSDDSSLQPELVITCS